MKAIQKTEPKPGAVYHEIPDPTITDSELLVKIGAAAFCKSDVDVYEWAPSVATANYELPFTMGHEYCGEVMEVGKSVRGFRKGDHVAGETHVPCGHCYTCRTGNPHICGNNMGIVGRSVHGSFAGYMAVPEVAAVKVNKDMPLSYGALMEPLGVALHALQVAGVSGKSVVVFGCGTIGRMAVELSKILGATRVIGVSRSPQKLEAARNHGADVVINGTTENVKEVIMDDTKGLGVAVGIETTGSHLVINDMIDVMQIAGTCVLLGTVEGDLTYNAYMRRVVYRELVITGIFGRLMYETWELLKDILEGGRMNPSHYVGAEFPLKDYEKGLEVFSGVLGRIVLYP